MNFPTIFDKVTRLEIKHGGSITIGEDGTITGAKSAKLRGEGLFLEGKGGQGGGFTMVNSGGGVASFGGGSVTQTIVSGGKGTNMMINGVLIDTSRLHEIAVNPQKKNNDEPEETYMLTNARIETISLTGSATLKAIPFKFCADSLTANLSGSGDIFLPIKHFQSLSINLSGSGDVTGNETLGDTVSINLVGSGDVRDVHIVKSGNISLVGSGEVRVSAENPKNVTRTKMGSGSIKIRK
jgi:hypothetical protein